MSSFEWPPTGSGGSVPIYANLAAFPPGSTPGDLAVAADTGNLYEWNGTTWLLEASPSGAGPAPGSSGDMLYNSSGVVAADPDFTTNGSGGLSAASLNLSGLTASEAVLTDGSKNLISYPYSSLSLTGNNLVSRDTNGNFGGNNIAQGIQGVVPVGGTTTLTIASARIQNIQSGGSGSQTFVLPDATTLIVGWTFEFNHNGTGTVTIETNGGSTLFTMVPGSYAIAILTTASFAAGQWDHHWFMPSSAAYGTTGLTISGTLQTSGQYTNTVTTGTAPFVVSSTTQVVNLYSSRAALADTVTTNANLTGVITSVGNATSIASQTGTGTKFVVDTSPTLVTPNLGTPSTLVATNATGTAASLTAGQATNIVGGLGGSIPYQTAANTTALLANGTAGQVLSSQGTTLAPQWVNALTNPMTTLGDIIYENSTPAPARLAGNTTATKNFLTQTGNGSISAAPTWSTIATTDLPSIAGNTSVLKAPTFQKFTFGTSATYTTPTSPSPLYLKVTLFGGGGGGGGGYASSTGAGGGGGGAGGTVILWISSPASTYTYTVGAAVSSGSAGAAGGAGNNSTFSAGNTTAYGGSGGAAGTSATLAGAGAQNGGGITSFSGTYLVIPGSYGGPGTAQSSAAGLGGTGGNSFFPGAGAGGSGTFGAGGPGGGGNSGGGAGGAGYLLVEEFYQ
jgi:hypothetical protein